MGRAGPSRGDVGVVGGEAERGGVGGAGEAAASAQVGSGDDGATVETPAAAAPAPAAPAASSATAGPAMAGPAEASPTPVDPAMADPDVLVEERDFSLRSLLDLEAEHEAGDIDEGDYQTLKEAYTARAAAALHALEGQSVGREPSQDVDDDVVERAAGEIIASPRSRRSRSDGSRPRGAHRGRRRALIGAAVVVVAAGAAWAVVASSATRLPGQEITGQALGAEQLADSLQQAQQAADRGDDLTAVKDYQKILQSDPNQPQALVGEGWLLAQTQQPDLLRQGLTMLLDAEHADPTYAPAHVYRGISLLSEGDYSGAIPELQWYLTHNPDPGLAPQVRTALQQAKLKAVPAAKG
jgi:tetratricopeptide (TPR) repeat protein